MHNANCQNPGTQGTRCLSGNKEQRYYRGVNIGEQENTLNGIRPALWKILVLMGNQREVADWALMVHSYSQASRDVTRQT